MGRESEASRREGGRRRTLNGSPQTRSSAVIWRPPDAARHPTRSLHHPIPRRSRGHGDRLPRHRPDPRAGRGPQSASSGIRNRLGPHRALPARGARARRTEPPEHRHHLLAEVSNRHHFVMAHRAIACADCGRHAEARALHEELRTKRAQGYVPYFSLAISASAIGDMDGAIEYAQQACDEREPGLVIMTRVFPNGRRLREDSRFAEVLRRLALPNRS
jgi:hypothetical protein